MLAGGDELVAASSRGARPKPDPAGPANSSTALEGVLENDLVLVRGGAGHGKTLLAREFALRESLAGRKVPPPDAPPTPWASNLPAHVGLAGRRGVAGGPVRPGQAQK
ncbi:MAG: hypothetical protein M0C28_03750 [Candidatus Moduliflexus flocculans]|nr:hypothetical protein [Candidatus Moduliflexus flocculans]